MKKLLLFLIVSIVITTCNSQTPDINFYSQELVDSLLAKKQKQIDSLNVINDSLLSEIDVLNDSIANIEPAQFSNDSIFYGNKELKIIALDSAEFDIFVKKEGVNTWYEISHEDKKIKLDYVQDTMKIFIGKGDISTLYLEIYMPFINLLNNIKEVGNESN